MFGNAPAALIERFGDVDVEASLEMGEVLSKGFPVEPMLVMLAITAVMLLLAGRIWQEVEA